MTKPTLPRHLKTHIARFTCLIVLALIVHRTQAQAPANYSVAWEDTFSGSTIDNTKWWYRMGISGSGSTSAQLQSNVSLDGSGHAVIATKAQSFAGTSYTGGGLISQETFRYGYFETTLQTPSNSGWHTAFWLTSSAGPKLSWNPNPYDPHTEIDGLEVESQSPSAISMGVLNWSGTSSTYSVRCNAAYNPGFSTASGLHTYGIEWTESDISYYVDGAKVCGPQAYSPSTGAHTPLNIWLTSIANSTPITAPAGGHATFGTTHYYIRDYYINPAERNYAEYGSGWGGSSTPGFSGQAVRYSCSFGASAVYTPTILAAGNYSVQVWKVVSSTTNDTAADAAITSSSGTTHVAVDFSAGQGAWANLGTYSFTAGNTGNLQIARGNNCLRPSMVKFVRQ